MYVAAIDIGTNSVRLLTAEINGERLLNKQKQLAMTRIGKDVDATKNLQESRMQDTIEALASYRKILDSLNIEKCPVFATSAVRDAQNRQTFVERVKDATGFDIDVIDGNREARLGFLGVIKGSGGLAKKGNALIIDIGGGSTELIVGNPQGEILHAHSLNIGAVRLTERHHIAHQGQWSDFEGVIKDVKEAIEPLLPQLTKEPIAVAFGIGGTATTVGAMHLQLETYQSERVHLTEITNMQVLDIASKLIKASLDEKLSMKGLMPKRAEIISSGVVILSTILASFNLKHYVVSDDDNLEGAIYEQIAQIKD